MASLDLTPRIAALYDLQAALMEPKLKKLGIGWSTFQLLSAVRGAGDEASQADVARRLGVTPATLSEAVTAHTKRGLLEQVPSGRDRRVKLLALTGRAKKILNAVLEEASVVEEKMVADLSKKDIAALLKLLDQCIDSVEPTA